jgi:uncharacterized phage protein (TIGR02216 family)
MRFGLGRLRLSSDQFWAMTPVELAAGAHSFSGWDTSSLSLSALQEMMRQYPDAVNSEVKQ